jgi:hypothetical protein
MNEFHDIIQIAYECVHPSIMVGSEILHFDPGGLE